MPIITKLPFASNAISLSVERNAFRSPGLHLSTIIKDMKVSAGIIKKQSKGGAFSPEGLHRLFEQGFLWERMVAEYQSTPEAQLLEWEEFVGRHWAEGSLEFELENPTTLVYRPGEFEMDGVYMTPDAINTKYWHLEEWKSTKVSSKNFDVELKRPEWLWQTASYCRALGMNRAVVRVWHFGELPPDPVTQLVIDFTDEEIEDNWRKIINHAKWRKML